MPFDDVQTYLSVQLLLLFNKINQPLNSQSTTRPSYLLLVDKGLHVLKHVQQLARVALQLQNALTMMPMTMREAKIVCDR
jgi:hypothetical protein